MPAIQEEPVHTLTMFLGLLPPVPLAAVSISAEPFFKGFSLLTNSVFYAVIVVAAILLFARAATRNVALVPSGAQNLFEFIVEFLYGQVEQIVGEKVAPKAFPLLATLFIYILFANWFGLLPGVGTIGFSSPEHVIAPLTLSYVETPILRPPTADINLTLGMALCFMLIWAWITYKEMGIIGFLKHTFAPKGGLTGFIGYVLIPIFLFVGVIEVISIMFRPVSLSLRLFGNVYAGESLLHAMAELGQSFGWGAIGSFISKIIFPLPFYFLEILVGLLQAIVFSLLCAVYIQLSTTHDEEDH